ncbi:unnamed protein product [Medioppia subpectinata]|uniref:Uncharacterized protein n=1 Tax=Medioppia subpectinata TaxID=1979941 RepID=A0A7R9KF16_9ACAR|nr:unnamed protein product [Medioppia subpectinata]CAG2100983.1 unnamed protein product [Medioppia subpectinata]
MDDTYHKTGGPVFLMIGGEGAGDATLSPFLFMLEMAEKYGALAVTLEHRYYGNSMPTPDLTVENMKYLSSEMALKDTEQFALYLTKKLSLEGSKWVAFGGSYAGALAAWFREKYPNIAVGAIASSAPVEAVVDNTGYLGVMSERLGKKCSDNIRYSLNASLEIENLLKTPEGVSKLRKLFNICDTFDGKNKQNNWYFAEGLFLGFAVTFQYFNDGIDGIIETMNDPSGGTPLERLAGGRDPHPGPCHNVTYDDLIGPLKRTTIDYNGSRQWAYQTCTEFGYYQTSDLPNSPFANLIPIEYYTQQCTDIFGPEFTAQSIQKGVDRTNANYGGLKPNVTNVVFPNGSDDPWHALSVLKDLNNSTKAVMIDDYTHCQDMFGSKPSDTQSLKNAHKLIEQQIGEYLK